MNKNRFALGALTACITLTAPLAALAQGGVSLGPTNRTSTQMGGPTGTYYYPGFGYSSRPLYSPYYTGYPSGYPVVTTYGAPVAVPGFGGYFRIGNARINYWQGPSGYYYPWGIGTAYQSSAPIYIVNQGVTTPQLPPLSAQFSDMENYLDDSQKKGKLNQTDYSRLFRRLQDIRSKFDHARAQAGGNLDSTDEDNIRRDLDNLGGEISRAVKPVSANTGAQVKDYR